MIYNKIMFFNEPIHIEYDEKNDKISNISINERIVEIPFVFKELKLEKGRILDVGCCESKLAIQLASLGYKVYGLDLGKYYLDHKNFTLVNQDITCTNLPNRYFDRVIAISSIEHIGLGKYDDIKFKGDIMALREINRVLKEDGKLLITLPFGQPIDTSWYRVYDINRLLKLFDRSYFKVEKAEYYFYNNGNWEPCSKEIGEKVDSHANRVNAVACIVASKINFIF